MLKDQILGRFPDQRPNPTLQEKLAFYAVLVAFTITGLLVANQIVSLSFERLLLPIDNGGRSGLLALYAGAYGPVAIVSVLSVFFLWSFRSSTFGIGNLAGLRKTLLFCSGLLALYLPNWFILLLFDDLRSIAHAHGVVCIVIGLLWLCVGHDVFGRRQERRGMDFLRSILFGVGGVAAYLATAQGWLTTRHETGLAIGPGIDLIHLAPMLDIAIGTALASVFGAIVNLIRGR